ncbi:MAG: PAS domain S-box protein, partial [Desulfatitalea sp.]|nr:PAS domain S-box protein [Desulfatitalea sp.]
PMTENHPPHDAGHPDEIQRVVAATTIMQARIDTSYQTLQASKKRYRTLLSQMSAGFALHEMIYDSSGRPRDYRFLEINRSFGRLIGLEKQDIVGKTVLEVLPDTEPSWIDTCGRVASTGEAARIEHYSAALGCYFDVVAYRAEQNHFAVIFTDVTEKKRVEKAQAELKASLENTVRKRTEDLRKRVEEAERLNKAMVNLLDDLQESNRKHETLSHRLAEANKELEAFTYSVSHDLRAPLRGIDGFSKALLEDYADRLDESGQGYLNRVRMATQRMGGLIDDLLRLSRVSRAELNKIPLNLSALAREIADQLLQSRPERNVEIRIADAVSARADARLIYIVLENLLGNAFKFTGAKEAALIEFGRDRHDGESVFWVRDNGAGFDEQYVDNLFEAFQRLHRSDEFEGAGIGLSIVKRIVQRHGGRVWAEGKLNIGATVFFTLSEK